LAFIIAGVAINIGALLFVRASAAAAQALVKNHGQGPHPHFGGHINNNYLHAPNHHRDPSQPYKYALGSGHGPRSPPVPSAAGSAEKHFNKFHVRALSRAPSVNGVPSTGHLIPSGGGHALGALMDDPNPTYRSMGGGNNNGTLAVSPTSPWPPVPLEHKHQHHYHHQPNTTNHTTENGALMTHDDDGGTNLSIPLPHNLGDDAPLSSLPYLTGRTKSPQMSVRSGSNVGHAAMGSWVLPTDHNIIVTAADLTTNASEDTRRDGHGNGNDVISHDSDANPEAPPSTIAIIATSESEHEHVGVVRFTSIPLPDIPPSTTDNNEDHASVNTNYTNVYDSNNGMNISSRDMDNKEGDTISEATPSHARDDARDSTLKMFNPLSTSSNTTRYLGSMNNNNSMTSPLVHHRLLAPSTPSPLHPSIVSAPSIVHMSTPSLLVPSLAVPAFLAPVVAPNGATPSTPTHQLRRHSHLLNPL
jgi:hypothetical protein